MKIRTILATLGLIAMSSSGIADDSNSLDELEMGLSKTSVCDTPTPSG